MSWPRRHQHFRVAQLSTQLKSWKKQCVNLRSKLGPEAEYWLEKSWWRWSLLLHTYIAVFLVVVSLYVPLMYWQLFLSWWNRLCHLPRCCWSWCCQFGWFSTFLSFKQWFRGQCTWRLFPYWYHDYVTLENDETVKIIGEVKIFWT